MRRILLVLPISAVLITGMVLFRLNRRPEPPVEETASEVRPAPLFQLYDQHSKIVRLARYVGRDKLLIAFFDGREGPDQSTLLAQLRERYPDLHRAQGVVLAISAARPSQNRYGAGLEHLKTAPAAGAPGVASEIQYPFLLLSDIVDYEVHKLYGAYDSGTQEPIEAVFIVDRAGMIEHAHLAPNGLGSVDDWVRELQAVR